MIGISYIERPILGDHLKLINLVFFGFFCAFHEKCEKHFGFCEKCCGFREKRMKSVRFSKDHLQGILQTYVLILFASLIPLG